MAKCENILHGFEIIIFIITYRHSRLGFYALGFIVLAWGQTKSPGQVAMGKSNSP